MQGLSVSIALPVKNGLPHLKSVIEGLCRQTYRNFELFVQDSVSTDGSVEFLRSLDTFFRIDIVSEPDPSLVAGYNRAIQRCTGDLVVAAACDEVLDDDALEQYVRWHEEDPNAVFIYSGMRMDDGSGAPPRDYQPLPFDLIDFLRHRMSPPMAGVFNRRLLGDELRLDETLKTVPDFELMTRLALRFGPERIVCKQAITATARADATSMTFRPDVYRQIAVDKTTIIDRLFSEAGFGQRVNDGINDEFLSFFHREILADMHVAFARHIYEIAGDSPDFREHVRAAHLYMPAKAAVEHLARNSRFLEFDSRTLVLSTRASVPPAQPPADLAEIVVVMSRRLMQVPPGWASAGASQEIHDDRNVVTTSDAPWSYAAWVKPELIDQVFDLELDRYWYWVKVSVLRAEGAALLSLYDPNSELLLREVPIPAGEGPSDIYLELRNDGCRAVLLRNGHGPDKSVVEFKGFSLIRMPIAAAPAVP